MRSRLEVGDIRNVDAGKVPQDFLRPESDLSDLLQPMEIFETLTSFHRVKVNRFIATNNIFENNFWNGNHAIPLRGVWFSPKLSFHRNISMDVYLPIFNFSFYRKNKFSFC